MATLKKVVCVGNGKKFVWQEYILSAKGDIGR